MQARIRPCALPAWYSCLIMALMLVATAATRGEPTTAPAAPSTQPSVMRFQRFVITDDPTYTGMEVTRGIMPAGWKLKGGVVWDLRDGYPAQFRLHVSDPQDIAAFDVYPDHHFHWDATAAQRGVAPGTRYMGAMVAAPPADQFEALVRVILPQYRPELAKARVVDQEKLPKVAEVAFREIAQSPKYEYRAAAGRMRFEYELNGQTVQEDFYIVFKQAVNPRLHFMNWTVDNVTSTRGIKGTLDQLNMVRAVMARAGEPNIAWFSKVSQFILMRQKATMRQLADQEQRRQIFMKMQNEISDERKQAFESHMRDVDARSDAYGDYMREVSPWKTSDGSSIKLPTQYGHAWEGTNGEILMNNDPLYNPNSDPNNAHATWTPMEQAGK